MFTGLIEEIGVAALRLNGEAKQLQVVAPFVAGETQIGDSVAVNGCCLTVSSRQGNELTFDLLQETVDRTNLKALRRDSRVNLERALAAGGRLGGHFVQGHVDCTAPILALNENGADLRIEIGLPEEFAHYVACKGSIAVNGISLTVAEVSRKSFVLWIVPHTRTHTNLATVQRDDLVNLEFDLLAKYVERMLERRVFPPA